ncbi:hypothetical protein [Streptomyces sp. BE133]|uniref:hypothetical protein n=1 Tax=Streptomyces sp. BE133 TaxID=3002523 RepID=UPI003FA74E3A
MTGFLCEPYALEGAADITSHGSWRAPRPLIPENVGSAPTRPFHWEDAPSAAAGHPRPHRLRSSVVRLVLFLTAPTSALHTTGSPAARDEALPCPSSFSASQQPMKVPK